MKPWLKPFLAEAIGTFALVFIGAGAVIATQLPGGDFGLLGVAIAHGLVLAIAVSATMHISGGHINPAVTFGAWVGKVIDARTAINYIIAQLMGASFAALLLSRLYPLDAAAAVSLGTPMLADSITPLTGITIEAILTFFLVFTVFGTAIDERAPRLGGWAIGLVLTFDMIAGGALTGAAMNPARALGPAVAWGDWTNHLVYWAGPIIGGILAAGVYTRLLMPKAEEAAVSADTGAAAFE
jgi:MIP family channel proteins